MKSNLNQPGFGILPRSGPVAETGLPCLGVRLGLAITAVAGALWMHQAVAGIIKASSTNAIAHRGIQALENDPGLVQLQINQASACAHKLNMLFMFLDLESADHNYKQPYVTNLLAFPFLAKSPNFLICPADTNHLQAKQHERIGATNLSYELRMAGQRPTAGKTNVLLVCPVHHVQVLEDGTMTGGTLAPANVDRAAWAKTRETLEKMTPDQQQAASLAARRHAQQMICDVNLKQIWLALETYDLDHNGATPTSLEDLEGDALGTPVVFTCPADADKSAAHSWENYSPAKHLSYKLLPLPQPGKNGNTNSPAVVCPVHGRAVFPDRKVYPHGSPQPGSGKPTRSNVL